MAFATLRSGGIEGEGLLVDGGDGSFFTLLGSCCGGERRHLPMAVRFRLRRQLLLAAGFFGALPFLREAFGKGMPRNSGGAAKAPERINSITLITYTLSPKTSGAIPIWSLTQSGAEPLCGIHSSSLQRAAQLDRLSFTQRRIHRAGAVVPARWTILGW